MRHVDDLIKFECVLADALNMVLSTRLAADTKSTEWSFQRTNASAGVHLAKPSAGGKVVLLVSVWSDQTVQYPRDNIFIEGSTKQSF